MLNERDAIQLICGVEQEFATFDSLGPASATNLGDLCAKLHLTGESARLSSLVEVVARLHQEGDSDVQADLAAYFDSAFVQRVAIDGGDLGEAAASLGRERGPLVLEMTSMFEHYRPK